MFCLNFFLETLNLYGIQLICVVKNNLKIIFTTIRTSTFFFIILNLLYFLKLWLTCIINISIYICIFTFIFILLLLFILLLVCIIVFLLNLTIIALCIFFLVPIRISIFLIPVIVLISLSIIFIIVVEISFLDLILLMLALLKSIKHVPCFLPFRLLLFTFVVVERNLFLAIRIFFNNFEILVIILWMLCLSILYIFGVICTVALL